MEVIMSLFRFCILFLAFTMIKPEKISAPMRASLQKQNQNEGELMTLDWCKPLYKKNFHR